MIKSKSIILHVLLQLITISLCTSCKTKAFTRKTQPTEIETANTLAKDGLYKEAIYAFKRVLSKKPKNLTVHRNLGMIYVKTGDYSKAIKHLEKSLSAYADNFETNFYLGEAYRAREKFGPAIFRYNKALEIKPKNEKTLKALAWTYFKIRFYSEAIATTTKLKKTSSHDTQITIIQARTYLKIGRTAKALKIIQKGKALSKKNDLPYFKSVEGDIFYKMGKIEKAETLYREALKDQPLLAGALLGLGKTMIKLGKDTKIAIRYIERSIRLKPRLKESLFLLGKYYETKNPSKAKKYYKNFKKYASTDPEFQKEIQHARMFSGKKPKTRL